MHYGATNEFVHIRKVVLSKDNKYASIIIAYNAMYVKKGITKRNTLHDWTINRSSIKNEIYAAEFIWKRCITYIHENLIVLI